MPFIDPSELERIAKSARQARAEVEASAQQGPDEQWRRLLEEQRAKVATIAGCGRTLGERLASLLQPPTPPPAPLSQAQLEVDPAAAGPEDRATMALGAMNPRLLAPLLLLGVGCAPYPPHPIARSPLAASDDPVTGHVVTGAALEASHAQAARLRAICASDLYVPPAGDLVSISVVLSVKLSKYFRQPARRLCLVLDGAPLLAQQDALDTAVHVARGETAAVTARVTRADRHILDFMIVMDGAYVAQGFHFEVRSSHGFTVAGDEGGSVTLLLYEKPNVRIEQRPAVEWNTTGALTGFVAPPDQSRAPPGPPSTEPP